MRMPSTSLPSRATAARRLAAVALGLLGGAAAAADWPQLQCDPAKSGFQAGETVRTGTHTPTGYGAPVWRWDAPRGGSGGGTEAGGTLAGQPVAASGIVAIADVQGIVFALDETSGAERWRRDVGSLVTATLAIADGKVLVPTQAGTVLALRATDGAVVWTYRAAKGFAVAPTVDANRCYIGDKAGVLHAIALADGRAAWTFAVGGAADADAGADRAPILCAAAVLDGRVFIGAENLWAYALRASDGTRLWRRRLAGQSFVHGWVVASRQAGGTVLLRTQPSYRFHDLLNSDERAIEEATGTTWNGDPLGTAAAWAAEQRAISARLQAMPHHRTLWALAAGSGEERFAQPLPILSTSGSGDTPAAPVVDDGGSRAWTTCRSVYARFDGGGMVRQYGDLARLQLTFDPRVYADPAVAPGALGMRPFPRGVEAWEDVHKVSDEGEVLTGCANAVFSSTWVSCGGVDLAQERTFNVAFYSSDDTGSAGLYGAGDGVVVANGRILLRDTRGIASYRAR